MTDEPITNAELGRRIEHLGNDLRDDLRDVKLELAKLVPRELYDAHRTASDARVANLEAEKKSLQDAIRTLDEKWRNAIRWVVGAIAFPLVVLIIQILLSTKGIKP